MFPHVLFVLGSYAAAGAGVVLWRRRPDLARWYAVGLSILAAWLAVTWLAFPGAHALAAVPPVLAVSLLGFTAGLLAAALEAAVLLALLGTGRLDLLAAGLGLVEIAAVFGAGAAVHLPARRVVSWSWDYFYEARRLLEEARNRQGALSQALADLAHANEQLTRLNSLAQNLRQAADSARLAKEQFVTNVSHELRTPLNMIIGFSEMILNDPESYGADVPSALLADLAIIRRNADHLSDLIDDVLDLSQIEADQMALTREQVSIQEVIQAASDAVRPLFQSKRLFLDMELEGDIPPVYCDRTRIREVLLNLLSNAGRFTESGGVTIRARQKQDHLEVSVADTGPGMPPDQMDKLFQPFQQLDASIRRRYGGTGLGLNISKRFIELHGGKIWVESQPGKGTTFSFSLPAAPAAAPGSRFTRWIVPDWDYVHRVTSQEIPRKPPRPRLVVSETGGSLEHMLSRYFGDVDIVKVETVEAALQEIAAVPSQVLLLNHPRGDAESVLEQIERLGLPYEIPVIACSVPGSEEIASSLGANDYLIKPISRQKLLDTLERMRPDIHTVLIVDDEPEALRLFMRMLHSANKGYHILRARNGEEALRVIRQYRPDVVLMDLVMPVMDGFQLLRLRSEDPLLSEIPFIITSARDAAGSPIVTRSISVTRKGGISTHGLMQCVQALTQILAMPGQPGGPGLKEAPPAGSAY
jgi:signal transduction histidine kinase/CheY-like chemotaxis protein